MCKDNKLAEQMAKNFMDDLQTCLTNRKTKIKYTKFNQL